MKNSSWSPFDRNGNLRRVFYSDPWWKRFLYKKLLRWYKMGALIDDRKIT